MNRAKAPLRWRDDSENRSLYDVLNTVSGDPPDGLKDRVWQRVQDPGAKRRSPLVWAIPVGVAASAAIALVSASLFFGPGEKPVGRLADLTGHVAIAPPGSDDFQTATDGATLLPGSTVETGVRSWVRLTSDDQVDVVAEPNTRFRSGTLVGGESLILDQGTIVVAVSGPRRKRPVIVAVGKYKVNVVGTVFSVKRNAEGVSGFSVMEGVVWVVWPDGERKLRAGQTMVTARPEPMRMDEPKRALEILSVPRERIAVLEPAFLIGDGDEEEDKTVEVEATPPEEGKLGEERDSVTRHNGNHSSLGRASAAKGVSSGEQAETSEAKRLFDQALGSADPSEAVSLFDRVSKMKGPWAEVAAYRAARIAVRKGFPDSEERLKRLLSDYPRGKFAAEARLTLIEGYMRARQFGPASEEIAVFLSRHPQNERVGDVIFLRGEISRIRDRDCRSALKDYAKSVGRTRRDEDALFWRAWCLDEIGDPAAAKSMFESYLRRYPSGRHADAVKKYLE